MNVRELRIELPADVYEQFEQAARHTHRPAADIVTEAVVAAVPAMGSDAAGTRAALAQMAYLNDAALWQAARASMTVAQRERLEELHIEQQRRTLMPADIEEEQALLKLYRETVLVRAQAAAVLKHRGYDVSDATHTRRCCS